MPNITTETEAVQAKFMNCKKCGCELDEMLDCCPGCLAAIRDAQPCVNCGHSPDKPINDIWKDPSVQQALKDGRSADDIAVVACPACDRWGYYNEGSHFSCRFCDRTWHVCSEDEAILRGVPSIVLDGHTSLADTVTETTEGYHNETRN